MTEETSNNDPVNEARIASIKSVSPIGLSLPDEGFLASLIKYIMDNDLIDLEGDWLQDVELLPPEPGEKKLGTLSLFESQMFAIAMLAQEIIQDIMIEAQAQTAETAARLMRQQKHRAGEMPMQQQMITEEDRVYLNELSVVFHLARASYEFSTRVRLECFDSLLTIRDGYTVYKAPTE